MVIQYCNLLPIRDPLFDEYVEAVADGVSEISDELSSFTLHSICKNSKRHLFIICEMVAKKQKKALLHLHVSFWFRRLKDAIFDKYNLLKQYIKIKY